MPIEKQITPEQALKRISDMCNLQEDNIVSAEDAVKNSYNNPVQALGTSVIIDRRIIEGLTSALREAKDACDLKITLG